MSSVWIEIDLNVRANVNQTFAGFENVYGGHVDVGMFVTVFEAESRLHGEGYVTAVDSEKCLIYIAVVWSGLKPLTGPRTIAEVLASLSRHPMGDPCLISWVKEARNWDEIM